MDNVKRLPDAYKKSTDSNNYKLLKLNELATSDLSADLADILDSLDIKRAFGKTLDYYGAIYRLQRKGKNDSDYRAAIEAEIAKQFCGCDCNSIELLLAQIFGCPVGDVLLTDYSPHYALVQRLPIAQMREHGISVGMAWSIIWDLLPIGVFPAWFVDKHGTFEFAESVDDYDESAGFGNIQQTVGGYLGLIDE